MNFKTTIVLILLLAFAGGALWFVNSREPKDATDATAKNAQKIFTIADGDVAKIEVTPADGKKLLLDKSSGKWRLAEPVAAPAEAFEVDSFIRSLTGLESHGDVSSSTADSKSTGLSTPRYTIELTGKNGEKQTLLVGDKLAVGDNLYVLRKDQNKAAVVSADLLEKLDKPASDYRDKKLVTDYSTAGISQITLVRPDGKMVLVKKGDQWKIIEPAEMPAEKTEVDDIVFGLTGLRAAEFVSENPADAPIYELDKPRIVATLGAASPTTLPVGIAAPTSQPAAATSQPVQVVIKFGRYDDILKKNVLAMTSQSQAIAKVPATILDTINKKPLDLRDKRVLDLDPAQVSAITVKQEIAATTKPTSKPAVNQEIVIKRHKEVAVTQPAKTQAATTGPATTRATTQVAATQPATQPAPKWEIVGETKKANDGKIESLLNQLHPLRTRKYLEKAPPTTKPVGTYVVKITTEGPGGTPVNNYEVTLVDPGSTGEVIGSYNGLTFEADRALIQNVSRDYFQTTGPPMPGSSIGNEADQPPQSFDPAAVPTGP